MAPACFWPVDPSSPAWEQSNLWVLARQRQLGFAFAFRLTQEAGGLAAEEGAGQKPTAAPPAEERAGLRGKGPARSGQGDERAGRVAGKF